MASVFVSYSSLDVKLIRPFLDRLIREGFEIWWDTDILPGQDFAPIIENNLNSASCVIVLWTKNSVLSEMVNFEARYAKQHNKLLPILVGSASIPAEFSSVSHIKLPLNKWTDDTEIVYAKLIDSLHRLLGIPVGSGPRQASLELARARKRHKRLSYVFAAVGTMVIEVLLVQLQHSGKFSPFNSDGPDLWELGLHSLILFLLILAPFKWLVSRVSATTPTKEAYEINKRQK